MGYTRATFESFNLDIAASGTTSSSVIIAGYDKFALFVPTIDGSTIYATGNLLNGGTFYTVTKDGTAVTLTGLAATGSAMFTAASMFTSFQGLHALKICASTAQSSGSVRFILSAKG
jgi:hypothetical protein